MTVLLYKATRGFNRFFLCESVSVSLQFRSAVVLFDSISMSLEHSSFPEAGGRRQEAGGRRQEAGGRRQEAGGRRQRGNEEHHPPFQAIPFPSRSYSQCNILRHFPRQAKLAISQFNIFWIRRHLEPSAGRTHFMDLSGKEERNNLIKIWAL